MTVAQLRREWDQRLAEDGFRDAEDRDAIETKATALEPDQDRARLLAYPEVWASLPLSARRVWALMAILGWPLRMAAAHVGVHHEIARRWVRRVEERSSDGG